MDKRWDNLDQAVKDLKELYKEMLLQHGKSREEAQAMVDALCPECGGLIDDSICDDCPEEA